MTAPLSEPVERALQDLRNADPDGMFLTAAAIARARVAILADRDAFAAQRVEEKKNLETSYRAAGWEIERLELESKQRWEKWQAAEAETAVLAAALRAKGAP